MALHDMGLITLWAAIAAVLGSLALTFGAAQIAFSAVSASQFRELKKTSDARDARTLRLMEQPEITIITIRFVRTLATTGCIVAATLCGLSLAASLNFLSSALIMLAAAILSFVFFLVNELGLKTLVLKNALRCARVLSGPVSACVMLCSAFLKPLTRYQATLARRLKLVLGFTLMAQLESFSSADGDERAGDREADEREMIHSIYEFGDTEVHEIMVPRTDIVAVEDTINPERLIRIIKDKGHSRIPLFHDDIDNILGIIHAKDLLNQDSHKGRATIELKRFARAAHFVPENKKVHELLREFQKEKHHMAIVVDEYGGTAGLITLEDIIEEIVGDIQDEYDQEMPLYKKIDETTYRVVAKIDLHELNEVLNIDLPTEGEYESLGGFILSLTGYVPEANEVVTYEHFSFRVEKVVRNRIISILLKIKKPDAVAEKSEKAGDAQ